MFMLCYTVGHERPGCISRHTGSWFRAPLRWRFVRRLVRRPAPVGEVEVVFQAGNCDQGCWDEDAG